MPAYVWAVIVAAALSVSTSAIWIWRVRHRAPRTPEEKLRAAREAARILRRSSSRHHRDTFEQGEGTRDRYGGPLLKNSAYGDAAGGGGSG